MSEQMLTVKGVANRLSVSRQTVDNLIRNAEITAIRVRGAWRVKESDLEAYVSRNTRQAKAA